VLALSGISTVLWYLGRGSDRAGRSRAIGAGGKARGPAPGKEQGLSD